MAKIIYDDIQGIEQSWENYAGSSVEKFIKQQLQNKAGYIYRSQNKEGDYYYLYGFTDYEQFEAWAGGDSSITPLFRVQLPNVENDTFSANLTTNSNTTKIVNLGDGVIIGLKYTSTATNPTTQQTVDTGNDGTLIISRSANGSAYSIVGRVVIQSTPYAQDTYRNFDLTPYLVDGDNKIRLRVEDNVNGSISTNLTFQSVVNTTLAIENATSTSSPLRALQFQYYIQGQVAKTLHINVSQGALNQTFNYPIGENTYIEVPYTTPLIEMGVESGIIEVDAWITIDDTEVSSYHEISQFYYTDGSSSDTIIILNNVSTDIVNYTNAHLFDMTLYNQGADVEVRIQSTNGETRYLTLGYNNCQTGVVYSVYATLEVEGNADSIPAMVLVNSANFNCTPYAITIDNSEKMSPVDGADFVLNPKVRNNSEINPNTIINAVNGNVVSSTFTGFGFTNDGWVGDEDNINVLRIPSNHTLQINYDVFDNLRNGTSIELDYKVYNIFNESDEVIKMYSTNQNQQVLGFVMNATEASFYTSENQTKRDQDVIFQEGERTHMVINIVPNLANSGLNYIRIFINGILNREMLYSANAVFKTGTVSMIFGSQNCDIDIYGIRVYKTGLSASDIRQNFMSSLPDINSKVAFKDANNILSANGTISYEKARVKYNTLVWTGNVPSYSTGDRSYEGSLEINILDDAAHSGNITGLKIKGQGSSSKKYWKWNHQYDWNKIDGVETVWTDGNGETHTDGYPLTDNDPAATKLVAKLNWASSMQSHKLGSTALYTDLWKDIVGGNSITATEGYEKVRVSVHEKPFLYFVRENPNSQPVFYGLMTFGSGKYDKPTFGYDKNVFPDYLILEGSDNGKPLTLRQVPWFEDEVPYSDEDEAYLYKNEPNLDYGMGKQENITYFINAFNFAYLHSPFLVAFTGSIPSDADYKNQYWDTATRNVYRFDYLTEDWVNAGATKTNGAYDVLNLETQTGLQRSSYSSDADYQVAVIEWRKTDFKNRVSTYYNVNDVLYSMAFLKFIAASDNWCKNTYEYLDPVSHKICLAQDDMDTLFLTDNVGRKTKPYYVEEHDLDGENKPYFNGSDNVFFNLMEMTFESEEKNMMRQIFNAMTNRYDSVRNCMQHYYFDVQEYFPAVAYNETARLLYEEASVAQSQGIYDNGTPAISQSLGDQLQAEKQFINKRITYLQSWSSSHPFYVRSTVEPSLNFRSMTTVGGVNPSYRFNLTTWQYLYPKVGTGQYISTDSTRVPARNTYQTVNMLADGNTDTFIYGSDYYTSFGEFGGVSLSETFNLNGKRLLEFSADSREVQEYNFRPTSMSVVCPELREFCVYGCSTLTGSLDLSGSNKLTSIDLRGTSLSTVVLPESDTLTTVYLPNLTSIYINNLPNLLTLDIQSFSNLVSLNTDRDDLALDAMVNATNLSNLTLRNVNILTSAGNAQAVYDKLANPNVICSITGHIYIAKTLTTEEVSALSTKFGNSVFDSSSDFYITYIQTPISQILLNSNRKSIFSNDSVVINATFQGNQPPKSWDWTVSGTNSYTLVKSISSLTINTATLSSVENITITYTLTRQDNTVITQSITISACPYSFNIKYTNPSGDVVSQSIMNHTFDALFSYDYAWFGPYQIECTTNGVNFTCNNTELSYLDADNADFSTDIVDNKKYYLIKYGDNDGDGDSPWSNIEGFENWYPWEAANDTPSPMFNDSFIITINNVNVYVPFSIQTRLYRVNVAPTSDVQCINGNATVHIQFNNPASYNSIIETYEGRISYQSGNATTTAFATNITKFGCDFIFNNVNHNQQVIPIINIIQINPYADDVYVEGENAQYLYGASKYTTPFNLIYVESGPNIIAEYVKSTEITSSIETYYLFSDDSNFAGWDRENNQYVEQNSCAIYFPSIDNTFALTWDSINEKYTATNQTYGTINVYPVWFGKIAAEIPIAYFGSSATIGATIERKFTLTLGLKTANSFGSLAYAFKDNTELKSLELQGASYIATSLCQGCTSLTSATIPNGATQLKWNAFNGCSNLTSISIPSSVATINYGAFKDCSKMNTITINRSAAPTIENTTWGLSSHCAGYSSGTTNVLYVPSDATGYDTSNWTGNLLSQSAGKFTLSATL